VSLGAIIAAVAGALSAAVYGLVRLMRSRRRARLAEQGQAAVRDAEATQAATEARNAAHRDEDKRRDAQATRDARNAVEAQKATPPGADSGRRPRSAFADELGLD